MSPTMHMNISRNYLCLVSITACSNPGRFPVFVLRYMLIESEHAWCFVSFIILSVIYFNTILFLFYSFCPLQPSLLPSGCPSACSPCQAQLLLQTTWSVYKLCSEPHCSYMSPTPLQTPLYYNYHLSSTLGKEDNTVLAFFLARAIDLFYLVETVRVCV